LVQCGSQPVLPVGLKDEMGAETVKIFCPKCNQVFHPPPVRSRAGTASGVDGAAFGTTFPHLFLMTFSNLVPDPLPAESAYVPRVFGFRVYKSAQRRNSNPPPGALLPAAAAAAASPSQQPPPQRKELQPASAQQQSPKQEPTELDDRAPAPVGSGSIMAEKAEGQGNASSTGSVAASALKTSLSAPAGEPVATSAAVKPEPASKPTEGTEDGEDALSASQPTKSPRGGKRKKDGDNASTATSTDNNADRQQQPGGPTFLMETTSKRRRKTNGGT
jgi:Casein kinase II regulatory subunit